MGQKQSSTKKISRRQFFRIVAVASIAGLTTKFGKEALAQTKVASISRLLMGTVVNLTVVHEDPNQAQSAIRACFDRMVGLEGLLSHFIPESQLSILNRKGNLVNPNKHLINLVKQSQTLSTLSEGAFDITIKPVIDAIQSGRVPTDEERSAVGYQKLMIDDGEITFLTPRMSITLDGIAKGYIIDRGVEVLQNYGFDDVLVEAGGDLVARGNSMDGDNWRLRIAELRPQQEPGYLPAFSVSNNGVATSGDYLQYYRADKSLHHIINPQSNTSPAELASVTIIAPTAMLADGLSTTIMVLGSKFGLHLLEQLSGVEGLLVSKNLEVFRTSNFPT